MIYTRKTNFSYPILTYTPNDYNEATLDFSVDVSENSDEYIFKVKYSTDSKFIKRKIKDGSINVILVIKSRDNQFHILDSTNTVRIKKSRLALVKSKTILQIMLQANEDISFADNDELNEFFDEYKDEIVVHKGMAIGFSDIETFDGSTKKAYELFEKRIDSSILGQIEVELTDETIMIVYKSEEVQFLDNPESKAFNMPYLYIGLQKALTRFIVNNLETGETIEEGIKLDRLSRQFVSQLDEKLYRLMIAKDIEEISLNNMDEVIHLITSNMMSRYVSAVRGTQYGN